MRTYKSPGAKFFHWESRGVPVVIELGPRDLAANTCVVKRRDLGTKEPVSLDGLPAMIEALLGRMQSELLETARALGLTRRGLYLKLRRLGIEGGPEVTTK